MPMTHRQLGANVKWDGCSHGDWHERRILLGQHITQHADGNCRKEETDAHLDAVLGQCPQPLQPQGVSGAALRDLLHHNRKKPQNAI